ncbi:hypothetical protein B0H13DRAFT_1850691 [Mycena leptocephala]|nr:hypothetical protein B0H13DRAFT_1850691 [Mycena leptocephala]
MDTNMADVDITQYRDAIEGPKVYNLATLGWTTDLIQANQKEYVLKELSEHPDDCIAAVILTSDFVDRARGADAIKAILMARNLPDSDKIEVLPAIPETQAQGAKAMTMPWTQILTNCTAALKVATEADPVFHVIHEGSPTSFYCIPVRPQTPWIFAAYVGLTDETTDYELKSALFTRFISDLKPPPVSTSLTTLKTGDLKPELVLAIDIHWGTVTTTAHRVMIAPISKDHAANQRFRKYITTPGFSIDAQKRGEATSWFTGSATNPIFMSCSECHGIDHYYEFCPIFNSKGYREVHGIVDVDMDSSSIPTSLLSVPDATPTANGWTSVPYRGGNRGRGRGGPRGRGGNYNNGRI